MKKIALSALLACSLFAAGEMYTHTVKPVYLDASSTKVIGKLLPTNAVKILETTDNRVKIAVRGYQNPAVGNVVYFSNSERIIAIAFAKTAHPEIKLIKKGKDGAWDEVEAVAYTDKDGFSGDLKGLFAKGETLYKEGCGVCHGLHESTHYKANQWPALMKSMMSRTAISKEDEWLVIQFLQKHSGDVNIDKR
ncbi:cytochrome C [Campylobacter rectus]|uniref:cytochrome C n=1 Tax=Campylobacter rectus TaxID=203 RepID=UPI0028E4B9EC|nr:cytochrome C [Campylobacter rectus]